MEHQTQDHTQSENECNLERLHPSLRDTFVSLPGGHNMLTPEQLDAVFGGDRRALRDMAKLLFQSLETEQNIDR